MTESAHTRWSECADARSCKNGRPTRFDNADGKGPMELTESVDAELRKGTFADVDAMRSGANVVRVSRAGDFAGQSLPRIASRRKGVSLYGELPSVAPASTALPVCSSAR